MIDALTLLRVTNPTTPRSRGNEMRYHGALTLLHLTALGGHTAAVAHHALLTFFAWRTPRD